MRRHGINWSVEAVAKQRPRRDGKRQRRFGEVLRVAGNQPVSAAFVVAERGLLFDFLAWYRPIVAYRASQTEPTLAELAAPRAWRFQQSGTLTTRHYANLQLKSVGRIDIDEARLDYFFPDRAVPFGPVVGDVSISGSFTSHFQEPDGEFWDITSEAIRPGLRALSDVEAGAEVSDDGSLGGPWCGEYSDDGDDDPPRSFVATLKEVAGLVRGRIDEMATATDKPGRPLEAIVEGRRAARAVRLIKRYVSATKRYIPIVYDGEASEARDRIAGRWSMRTGRTGRFVMSRAGPYANFRDQGGRTRA
jgi:hypothetical protein